MIAPQGNSITTYGLLDNASLGTIISKDIANILCLEGQKELVSVNTIMEKTEQEFEFVRFQLQSTKGVGEIIDVEKGLVSERFNISEKCLPKDIDRTCHPHLRDIEIPEVDVKKVSALIGKDVDYAHDVVEERKPGPCRSQLKGVRGPLGLSQELFREPVVPMRSAFTLPATTRSSTNRLANSGIWSPLVHARIMKADLKPAFAIFQHLATYQEKTFVRSKFYRRRLGCLKVIMRLVCFGETRMLSYQTTDPRR